MAMRACMLTLLLALVGLAVVHVRTEMARALARSVQQETRWLELRREHWALQTKVARLRSPARIHESVAVFQTGLQARGETDATVATVAASGSVRD